MEGCLIQKNSIKRSVSNFYFLHFMVSQLQPYISKTNLKKTPEVIMQLSAHAYTCICVCAENQLHTQNHTKFWVQMKEQKQTWECFQTWNVCHCEVLVSSSCCFFCDAASTCASRLLTLAMDWWRVSVSLASRVLSSLSESSITWSISSWHRLASEK